VPAAATAAPERTYVAGIDVSNSRGLDLAVLGADGRLLEGAWLPGLEALRAWLEVWQERLAVVAVDAPSGIADRGGGRAAEQELWRLRLGVYPAAADRATAFPWMQVGFRLFELLDSFGFPEERRLAGAAPRAIECYPYAAYVALSGHRRPPGEPPAAWARRLVRTAGYALPGTGKDLADAVAAALTALAYLQGRAVPYGDPSEGVIWVPAALPTTEQ
jgi:predicted nuclease with RNAse H fold